MADLLKRFFDWILGGIVDIIQGVLARLMQAVASAIPGLTWDYQDCQNLLAVVDYWYPVTFQFGLWAAYGAFAGGLFILKRVIGAIPFINYE